MNWARIRYGIVTMATLVVAGYHCFVGMQVVGGPAQAKSEPITPPALTSQIYVIAKVIGITEGDADASTMEVTFFQKLDRDFSNQGQKDRVRRSYKKYEDTRRCKDCDIVAIKEPQQRRAYELHVICPMNPNTKQSGALEDIPCAQNLRRTVCRDLVLLKSVRAITAHDRVHHGRSQ